MPQRARASLFDVLSDLQMHSPLCRARQRSLTFERQGESSQVKTMVAKEALQLPKDKDRTFDLWIDSRSPQILAMHRTMEINMKTGERADETIP